MSAVGDVIQGFAHSNTKALALGDLQRAIAFDMHGQTVTLAQFFAHVRAVAEILPQAGYAINLCENRYRFLVGLCAVAYRGQINLLPSSRTRGAIEDVAKQYSGHYILRDHMQEQDISLLDACPHVLIPDDLPVHADHQPVFLHDDQLLAIGFTSGSTGTPKPNRKTWGSFCQSTAQNLLAMESFWKESPTLHLVATVPAQHMYGMEMSVLLPLLGNIAVYNGRPFFPQDVLDALNAMDAPRMLVTTPLHLRALIESEIEYPHVSGIVTATAPLSAELAQLAEQRFGCEVREMFGSTETCMLGHRRTAQEEFWTPMQSVQLKPQPDGTLAYARHLTTPTLLADIVELDAEGRFVLRGRQSDMLEIAGKRASLGDINRRVQAIPGVKDAVVFQPDEADLFGVRRLLAIVVTDTVTEADILSVLRETCDPVFLPRKIYMADNLPRNETGKLARSSILKLYQQLNTQV